MAARPPSPTTIPWSQLGRPDRIDIRGSDQAVDTDIPVPQGVTPGLLTGQTGSAANVVDGRVDVLDGGACSWAVSSRRLTRHQCRSRSTSRGAQIVDSPESEFVLRDHNPSGDSCSRPPEVTLAKLVRAFRRCAPSGQGG